MPKEHPYIHDSDTEPLRISLAQQAFFRYQYTLGSYEYTRTQEGADRARSLSHELNQRFQEYTELRDSLYATSTADEAMGEQPQQLALFLRERAPLQPNELPPELADFLRNQHYACLMQATDVGTVFVVKAPTQDIQSLRGNVPARVLHELHQHPRSPVIRTVIRWYDRPDAPLAIETFTNIADEQQRADLLDLAQRDELRFLFYDEGLRHRLSKSVRNAQAAEISRIVATADQLRATIPTEAFDFDQAKAEVMRATSL
jgi:hypothetical protein